MFISNLLWSNYDFYVCKWPKGTFITNYFFKIDNEGVNIRLRDLEIELSAHPPRFKKEEEGG